MQETDNITVYVENDWDRVSEVFYIPKGTSLFDFLRLRNTELSPLRVTGWIKLAEMYDPAGNLMVDFTFLNQLESNPNITQTIKDGCKIQLYSNCRGI